MLLLASLAFGAAAAQKYGPDDPIPPGATAKVLTVSGKITEVRGLASAVSGKAEALGAALDLRPEAIPSLQKVGAVINGYPALPVLIEGHTDAKDSDSYNMTLSESRAASVKGWLVRNGGVEAGGSRPTAGGRRSPWLRTPSPTVATIRKDGRKTAASRSPSRRASR